MPYLYCAVDGRRHEDRAIEQQEEYRQQGESVLIVHGALKTGPWHCDTCSVPLTRGDTALLMTAFPRHFTEGMDGYDFAPEKRYFDMKRAQVAVYGVQWPDVAWVGR
jgi:hypothetical protein